MVDDLELVQERIHYRFGQVKHLARALTHSSFANEQGSCGEDNERLEFLGDAVLDLVVSEEALVRYPGSAEGQLTRLRSGLVKEKTLAAIAQEVGLNERLWLGRGEEAQGGRQRTALLADALEALLGAVFLDGGYGPCREVVLRLFAERWPDDPDLPGQKDFKSRLQEITQKRYGARPTYVPVSAEGPEHEKVFTVDALLPDGRKFRAAGPSLKKAEQSAARAAVDEIGPERVKPGE